MSYSYEKEKHRIFTDSGQKMFLNIRDNAKSLLSSAGAFMLTHACSLSGCYDTWEAMACVDRMVELGEIREITSGVAGQYRVFVRN